MSKPLLLTSKNFSVVDARRGQDYENSEGFSRILPIFKENMEAWNELISCVFDEFNLSGNVLFHAMGDRKSFLGQANRSKLRIKITPCSKYPSYAITTTIIHELAHLATPISAKLTSSGVQRDIHGPLFKKNAYTIAKWAYAVGLLEEDQVKKDIGSSTINVPNKNEKKHSRLPKGTIIQFEHSGHKWGGVWTGEIVKVNRKTYKVRPKTKDGKEVNMYSMTWTIPVLSSNFEVVA
jgi:hypothetical protein